MKNFDAEVLGPRRQAAAACSAVLSVGWLAAAVTVAALSTSPLQPLAAAREVVATLTSLSSLPTVLLYAGLVVWSSLHHSTTFVTTPTVIKSWASVVYKVVSDPGTLASVVSTTLTSTGAAWSLLRLGPAPYSTLLSPCPAGAQAAFCFNESHLALLAAGAATGLAISISYNFFSDNSVVFPVIAKERWAQVGEELRPLAWRSALAALRLAKVFYPAYLVTSLVTRAQPASVLLHLLDPSLLAMALTLITLLFLVNSTRLVVFTTLATEPVALTLTEVLEAVEEPSSHPLLRLLALQQLATLSAAAPAERAAVFALSQPGGHPHRWNSARAACLAALTDISTSVAAITNPKPAAAPAPAALAPIVVASPIRRLAPALPAKVEELVPAAAPSNLHTMVASSLESLKSKPLLSALFHVTPEHGVRAVLCRGQAACWAARALSHLAAASVAEDRFGVVQKDLPSILSALLEVEQTLVRTRSLSLGRDSSPDLALRQELRAAVKAALYRIVVTFGEHILEVPLPAHLRAKVLSYQRFLEA